MNKTTQIFPVSKFNEEQAESIYKSLSKALNCDKEAGTLLKLYIYEICKTRESCDIAIEVKRILNGAFKININ